MSITAETISFNQIRALRTEALADDNYDQVAVCDLALDGKIDMDDYTIISSEWDARLRKMTREEAYTMCANAINSAHTIMSPDGNPIVRWSSWGSVRGQGPIRLTRARAEDDLDRDAQGCAEQGGYSDRDLIAIDAEGWCWRDVGGGSKLQLVWPYGRHRRALKIDLDEGLA